MERMSQEEKSDYMDSAPEAGGEEKQPWTSVHSERATGSLGCRSQVRVSTSGPGASTGLANLIQKPKT